MSDPQRGPVGVVLAGGAGRRMGGEKALAPLRGRPLIAYPLAALQAVLADVGVVAKADTALPAPAALGALRPAPVWREPAHPRHPLAGVVEALERAEGRPVIVCAVDLPLVTPATIELLLGAGTAPVIVAAAGGRVQPLLGVYRPVVLPALRGGLARQAPVLELVRQLCARVLELEAPDVLSNVNTPEDLARASELLAS